MNTSEPSQERRGALLLTRLERLSDVVYGIIIWQLFMLIPTPDSVGKDWDSLGAYLDDAGITILVAIQWYSWLLRRAGRGVAWKDRVQAES